MTQDFTLTINQDDINKLSEALGNMPFKVIAPLVAKINQQLTAQAAARANGQSAQANASPQAQPGT